MLGIGQGLGPTSKLGARTRLRLDQLASIGLKKRWAKGYYIKTPVRNRRRVVLVEHTR